MLIVSAVFMFSAMDTLAKYMLLSDYPVGALIWARYTVHLLVTAALLLFHFKPNCIPSH